MQGIDLSHKYKSISEWRRSETLAQKQQKICLKDEIQGNFKIRHCHHAICMRLAEQAGWEAAWGLRGSRMHFQFLTVALLFSSLLFDTNVPIAAMPDLIAHPKP